MDAIKLKMESKKANYVGEVSNQKRHGYGKYVYPNSFFLYEGEWSMGRKHGLGKLMMKDGSFYEGEFICGEIEGSGLRHWAKTGDSYSGEFKQGELHGFGVLQRASGESYEGQFCCGLREGHGSLTDSDGHAYLGSFHRDKRHGEGRIEYSNGDQYEGSWVLDQKQGQGVLRCVDGSLYDGQWRNNLFNGQGIMIHTSGMVWEGIWTNGRPLGGASIMVIEGGGEGGGGGGEGGVLAVVQGRAFCVEVRLQTADAGETVTNESGRVLQITAGVRVPKLPPSPPPDLQGTVSPALINTPFGFQVVSFPLMDREAFLDATSPVITSSRSPTTTTASTGKLLPLASPAPEPAPTGASDPSLASAAAVAAAAAAASSPPAAPARAMAGASCSSLPQGEWESGRRSDGSTAPGGGASATPGYLDGLIGREDSRIFQPITRRVVEGRLTFEDLMLATPPSDSVPCQLEQLEKSTKKPPPSKEPAGGQNANKNRRPSQGSRLPGNSKKSGFHPSRAVKPCEYVIIVEDVTSPPFMGQTLPTAFALLSLLPAEG
ncbi:MORN repeat-containing protein 1 isoform X2 [Gadus morhua]|uniref:MORN repeat-containing protein 1 isoform X2 n=2 Tax=Gadus TaxID=8048 RepID=UPI0011B51C5C|nr:MORN repeat-containing protein 1 isoform X2 [Gadus morhua]